MICSHNQEILRGLPQQYLNVFTEFAMLSQIPRQSRHHGPIEKYLMDWADTHHFAWHQDDSYNILISVPPSLGYENRPSVCLQAHTDMVCAKEDASAHNFAKDPILWRIEDKKLMAVDTSLGADDGIGVALALAIAANQKCEHGPLELLFTTDEEIGFVGARNCTVPLVSKYLINLDSEDFDEFTLSYMTYVKVEYAKTVQMSEQPQFKYYKIELGEHQYGYYEISPDNLRKNVLTVLISALNQLSSVEIHLSSINVRNWNKIPSFASIIVACGCDKDQLKAAISELLGARNSETLNVTEHFDDESQCLSRQDSLQLLNVLSQMASTPVVESATFPGEAEAVTILPAVQLSPTEMRVESTSFSFQTNEHSKVGERLSLFSQLLQWDTVQTNKMEGWGVNTDSPLFKTIYEVYKGNCPELKFTAYHTRPDMEADKFQSQYDGIDAITIGPTIHGIHTTDEELDIDTVGRTYDILTTFLSRFGSQ